MDYGKHFATRTTPQTAQARPEQKKNNAGGFVYTLDIWKRLDRFLVIGSDAASYYQTAQKLTRENMAGVGECFAAEPERTIAQTVAVSDEGRAPNRHT